MKYLLAYQTDVGIKRKKNQDSIYMGQASIQGEKVILVTICDGMGGLEKGELASAEVVREFSKWFKKELPNLFGDNEFEDTLYTSWETLLQNIHHKINAYGKNRGLKFGTTVTAMLFAMEKYYIAHVGDSRAYEITDQTIQLTVDQTLAMREVECGKLTFEEAEIDQRRSVLLQCIGASNVVKPVYLSGIIKPDILYLLCSDGFRHEVNVQELAEILNPEKLTSEEIMMQRGAFITEIIKKRGETDNISAIFVRSCKDRRFFKYKGCKKNIIEKEIMITHTEEKIYL